ncbi:MAG: hypothetical protein ACTSUJ_02805 [Candidatus Njordarchaeales archaeon]
MRIEVIPIWKIPIRDREYLINTRLYPRFKRIGMINMGNGFFV